MSRSRWGKVGSLFTLKDAATYIIKFPEAEYTAPAGARPLVSALKTCLPCPTRLG
ncbi:hypothetical protein [Bradyrhizobium erythrophlei]|uniref:Uncharacterized protein n=1 Tax=Bradyrhizobium erythrophlei TaxID=1437360 RepID=A0A1M5XY13_9BRAD|nr:hypothetical protein [Bradyrhizobium erythrophlei]SHI04705.1 hypothetical protein SAMN05443248_7725 [Bradyrhizobium erythrophlei]